MHRASGSETDDSGGKAHDQGTIVLIFD